VRVMVMTEGDVVSARFARAPSYVVFEVTEEGASVVEEGENPAAGAPRGAGRNAAALAASKGVDAVVAGRFGPNAVAALRAQGVRPLVAEPGTPAEEAAVRAARGELPEA